MVIGSVLEDADAHTEVWGAGFIRDGALVRERPKKVHAVRGPLTRGALVRAGVECPEVYGDPALLLPYLFRPNVAVQYEVGIIPHYSDRSCEWVDRYRDVPGVFVIDVAASTWDFVRMVKSCGVILSSSLHGLICADAYGVPNAWMKLSDNLIGGDFKFRDYYCSIGVDAPVPKSVGIETTLGAVVNAAKRNEPKIDVAKLLGACPFLGAEVAATLAPRGRGGCIS